MSENVSAVTVITAATLRGAWLHDVTDPDGTIAHFPYTGSRKRALAPTGVLQYAVGRALPVAEYGENISDRLAVTVTIPYDDDYEASVQWWRDAAVSQSTLCYRDNRGRIIFTSLIGGIDETDTVTGTAIQAGLPRIDYSEAL